jgi:hypothetical protein
LRTSEFESEFSTCDAVEERLHDVEGKGAPGDRWGGGAAAGNRVRTVEAAKQFGKIGGFTSY